jgi:hypothetical protein
MKSKQSGLSMLEALISLILTSILVGLSFMVFVNFNKTFHYFENSTTNLLKVIQFKNVIASDWRKCPAPSFNKSTLLLDSVVYEFDEDYILRSSNYSIDTFQFKKSEIQVNTLSTSSAFIQDFNLEFELSFQKYHVDLRCDYDVKTLLKIEP